MQTGTAQDLNKLQNTLDYLQTTMQTSGALASAAGANVSINHTGYDAYDPATDTIIWDPDSGLIVNNNGVTGVQSPARDFCHEATHKADPAYASENSTLREGQHTSGGTWVEREPDGSTRTGGAYPGNAPNLDDGASRNTSSASGGDSGGDDGDDAGISIVGSAAAHIIHY